ncbi:MAG: hypothetical protein WC495_05675 [Patescibacteria group bacterium]|jgi:ammonia channel protein AmtB
MKSNRYTIIAMVLVTIALVVIAYMVWYQGAQEKALDYGAVNSEQSQ